MRKQGGRKIYGERAIILSIVRQVAQETEMEYKRSSLKQLQDYITKPENLKNVFEHADSVIQTLSEVLQERCSVEFKIQIARCMGILIIHSGLEARRLVQWMFARIETRTSDEVKALLLSAILQAVKIAKHNSGIEALVPLIIKNLQTVLENADTPELLVAVTNAIHFMAQSFPSGFSSHFKDTVDILVGWHIDTTQKDSLIRFCADSLISLRPFWLSDLNFSVHLLSQFVEDLEAYSEDLCSQANGPITGQDGDTGDEIPSPDMCRDKIKALIGVFKTVVKALGAAFSPGKGPAITHAFISQVLFSIINSAETVKKHFPESTILPDANECIALISEAITSQLSQCQTNVLPFIMNQLESLLQTASQRDLTSLMSVLELFQNVCRFSSSAISPLTIQMLLGPSSYLRQLRYNNNKELVTLLLRVYQSLLTIKDVTSLELVYGLVLSDLELAFNFLTKSKSIMRCNLVSTNILADSVKEMTETIAEIIVTFDLAALAEIGKTKSLLGVWALTPSLFELLAVHLLPNSWVIARPHPAVHYALLHTLFTHCESHGHFITSSLGLALPNNVSEPPGGMSKTGRHFVKVLSILVEMLSSSYLVIDSRKLAIHWLASIIGHLQQGGYYHVFTSNQFIAALDAMLPLAYDAEVEIVLAVCECLQIAIPIAHLPGPFLQRVFEVCKTHLTNNDNMISSSFSHLLDHIPCQLLSRNETSPLVRAAHMERKLSHDTSEPQHLQILPKVRRSHMAKQTNDGFLWSHARMVLNYILLGEKPSEPDWLEKLYHSCQRPSAQKFKQDSAMLMSVDHIFAVQCFWVTWEAAQFCVTSKLRTPIGKPQDTFRSIEKAMKDFLALLHGEDGKANQLEAFSDEFQVHQRRPLMFLQFVEHLEKHVYNAIEGCATSLPIMNKAVKAFFKTNSTTCLDWFSMMRPGLFTLGFSYGQYAYAYRQSEELLQDLVARNATEDARFEESVMKAVQCLTHLGTPQTITGLQTWCERVSQKKFTWLSAIAKHAEHNYESCAVEAIHALKEYAKIQDLGDLPPILDQKPLKPSHDVGTVKEVVKNGPTFKLMTRDGNNGHMNMHANAAVMSFLADEVVAMYMAVTDYKSALEFQEAIIGLKSKTGEGNVKNISLSCDMNAIKALSSFQDFDQKTTLQQLDLIPGLSENQSDQKQLHILHADAMNMDTLRSRSWLMMLQALSQNHVSGCAANPLTPGKNGLSTTHPQLTTVVSTLHNASQLSGKAMSLALMDWPSFVADFASIKQIMTIMVNTIQTTTQSFLLPFGPHLSLNVSESDLPSLCLAVQMTFYQLHLNQMRVDKNPAIEAELKNHLGELRVAVATLARKLGNHKLSQRFLIDQLCLMSPSHKELPNPHEQNAISTTNKKSLITFLNEGITESLASLTSFNLERQCCKLLQSEGSKVQAWEQMSNIIRKYTTLANTHYSTLQDYVQICELTSRSLLGLVKWFTADYRVALPHLKQARGTDLAGMSTLARNLCLLLEMEHRGSVQGLSLGVYVQQVPGSRGVGGSPSVSENDAVCGRLLHLATMQSPALAKAWASLAAWCYRWGRKAVDIASEEQSMNLTPEERMEITSLLPTDATSAQCGDVEAVLNQAHVNTAGIGEEDITEQLQSGQNDGYETVRKKLISICPSLETSPTPLNSLLEIWQRICLRVYSHYRLAAWAYFSFLQLNGVEKQTPNLNQDSANRSSNNACSDVTDADNGNQDKISNQEDHNITATLRLLRLLVKHASQLKDVLETGLAATPTGPWKSIIPQLFSRLNHPEAYVRQSICDLLCRVAQDSPHLIIYQAVVGCPDPLEESESDQQAVQRELLSKLSGSRNSATIISTDEEETVDESDGDDTAVEDDEERNQSLHMMENSMHTILNVLSQHNPAMVTQTKLLVKELRRITLLWEELWVGTFNHVQHDLSRRLQQLEEGVQRIQKNESLGKQEKMSILQEKYKAILKPVVFALEQVDILTSRLAETPNEKAFQINFQGQIQKAFVALKEPQNLDKPGSCWAQFKQLHATFTQRAHRRTHSYLTLVDISPKLAELKGTSIPLPGLSCSSKQVTSIASITNAITILPTKTKPKKLVFIGNDGRRHTYLFKGLEDMHLDERIMQFLTIVNTMFGKNKTSEASLFHACHYSVTPLGPRSGLIQWVDGAQPLYGLYKRWQQRESMHANVSKGTENSAIPQALRPSELYFNKITQALKDEGLSINIPRKEWPLSIQRDVLQELVKETPKDLLSKEMWCSSGSSSEWWYLTQSFARSTAVMSIIGYIIGLGDRHLDNVLVNFVTGEVVHIDYNVCFEKGKNLRIPERVPFRLTQNIQTALGLTGMEGIFRHSCEEVLKILRKGRETLLTLLEAFVYDPLVDWTTGHEGGFAAAFLGGGHLNPVVADGGERRREMEREATQLLFFSRVAEIKGEWFGNRNALLDAMTDMGKRMEEFVDTMHKKEEHKQSGEEHKKQLEQLQFACRDKSQKHSMYTLNVRWNEVKQIKAQHSQVLKDIEERLREAQRSHLQHKLALDAVRGQQLNAVSTYLKTPLELGPASYTAAAQFLQSAGQGHLVTQLEKFEVELIAALQQRRKQLFNCMDKLQMYCSIAVKFPANFAEDNRAFVWQKWLQTLLADMSQQSCQQIEKQFEMDYSPPSPAQVKEMHTKEQLLMKAVNKAKSILKDVTLKAKREPVDLAQVSNRVENIHKQLQKLLRGHREVPSIAPAVLLHAVNMTESILKTEAEMSDAKGSLFKNLLKSDNGLLMKLQDSLNAAENVLSLPPLLAEVHKNADHLEPSLQCLRYLNTTIDQLLLLYHQFEQLWLPEVTELLQDGEKSLKMTITNLNEVVQDSQVPVDQLVIELENCLKGSVTGKVHQPEATTIEAIQILRTKYHNLLPSYQGENQSRLTSSMGEILLADIDDLFKQIRESLERVIICREKLNLPEDWANAGFLKDNIAKRSLQVSASGLVYLQDLLFLRQVQLLQEIFKVAQDQVKKQRGKESVNHGKKKGFVPLGKIPLANPLNIFDPIRRFLAMLVQRVILGIGSELVAYSTLTIALHVNPELSTSLSTLTDISSEVPKATRGRDGIKNKVKNELEGAVKDLVDAVHLLNRTRMTDNEVKLYQEFVSRAESRVVLFQWLHEDVLQAMANQKTQQFLHPSRGFVMSGIQRESQQLIAIDRTVITLQEKVISLQNSISQRLKWAAGANPTLSAVLQSVDQTVQERAQIYALEAKHTSELSALCNAILHFEALRTRTSEAIRADANIKVLLKKCQEVAYLNETSNATVSDMEHSLILLKLPTPEKPINIKWMRGVMDVVKKKITESEKLTVNAEVGVVKAKEEILNEVESVRGKLLEHNKLMSEVKAFLKTLAQDEEEVSKENVAEGVDPMLGEAARQFLGEYRGFSEELSAVLKMIYNKTNEEGEHRLTSIKDALSKFPALSQQITRIYDALVNLAKPVLEGSKTAQASDDPTLADDADVVPAIQKTLIKVITADKQQLLASDSGGATPPQGLKPPGNPAAKTSPAVMQDPRTGKLIQVRNVHAINVWRRVKGKLDGRDPEPSQRLGVTEQVDYVIREATNMDNLATLYEGWTAWV